MPKFQKRPVVISAAQWNGKDAGAVSDALCYCPINAAQDAKPHLHSLEGPMTVSPGDWIITGIKGEKYPCKPDIFSASYIRVPCHRMIGGTCEESQMPENYCEACK